MGRHITGIDFGDVATRLEPCIGLIDSGSTRIPLAGKHGIKACRSHAQMEATHACKQVGKLAIGLGNRFLNNRRNNSFRHCQGGIQHTDQFSDNRLNQGHRN